MVRHFPRAAAHADGNFYTAHRQMKELVNKEFSPLTFERYETSFRHTRSFLRWKLKVDDIDIKNLNYEFIADYEFWLKTERCMETKDVD